MGPLEVCAYTCSLLSLFLLTHRKFVLGYFIGALDVIPWCALAVLHWNAPGMLVLEGVYLAVNLYGLWKHRKEPLWADAATATRPTKPTTSSPSTAPE